MTDEFQILFSLTKFTILFFSQNVCIFSFWKNNAYILNFDFVIVLPRSKS